MNFSAVGSNYVMKYTENIVISIRLISLPVNTTISS